MVRARDVSYAYAPLPADEQPRPRPLRLHYDVDSLDNRDPWFIEQVVRVVDRLMRPYHRSEIAGLDNVPHGAALLVGNHNGGSMTIDSFLFGAALYRARGLDALPHILTHDFALRLPFLHQVFSKVGCVRASRDNARRIFDAGHKVLVYPGGSEESMRPFRERNKIRFHGHRGYVRIALQHGVPIVPLVAQGSHSIFVVIHDGKWLARMLGVDRLWRVKTWPLVVSLPWGFTPFPPPLYLPLPAKIRMEVLPPIAFDASGPEAARDEGYVKQCARVVETRMQEALERLARR